MSRGLAKFRRQVQRDPLFAAEGLDLANFTRMLDTLESAAGELAAALGSLSWRHRLFLIAHPIRTHVFPIPFLRAFVESERTRRIFLAEPTEEHARSLLNKWNVTQRVFEQSARRYQKLHTFLYAAEHVDGTFAHKDFLGNIATLADIDAVLELLLKNSSALKDDLRYYGALLRGTVDERAVRATPELDFAQCTTDDVAPELQRLHALEMQHGLFFRDSDILERFGPIRYNVPLKVGEAREPHFLYAYILKQQKSGLRVLKLAFADLYRFLPLTGGSGRYGNVGRALFESLIQRGVRYFYQPMSNLYVTRETGYWPAIATIIDLQRRPQLDGALVLKQKSGLLDLLIGAVVVETESFVGHTRERIARGALGSFSLLFGLLIRSYPSLLYLTFNGSVWRLPERPNFLGSSRAKLEELLYVDEKAVLADTTPEEFELVMQSGRIREEERLKKAAQTGS